MLCGWTARWRKDGFSAKYFWGTGSNSFNQNIFYQGAGCSGGTGYADGINRSMAPARYFGWRVGCTLTAHELLREGLWRSSRPGQGRAAAGAGEHRAACASRLPGMCGISRAGCEGAGLPASARATRRACVPLGIAVDGEWLVPPYIEPARDRSSFTQCHGSQLPALLDTTRYPNGGVPLQFGAMNAAGVSSAPAKTMLVDNAPVTLQLSGRTDAPSTAGTQYISGDGDGRPERGGDRVLGRRQPVPVASGRQRGDPGAGRRASTA